MRLKNTAASLAFTLLMSTSVGAQQSQNFFRLEDVKPGMRGVGRTVFHDDRVEDFQVEILGVLENLTPKQSIILARLSGGPLEETGVLQGMSGSPVYIDGKLLGAVALGFPFSKQPIAGIQPIAQMIADATFTTPPGTGRPVIAISGAHRSFPVSTVNLMRAGVTALGNLSEISTPLALSGFSSRTLETFAADFRKFGFEPQQGVSSGRATSQQYTGRIEPGSMISVQLLSGDWSISADGTVTYVDGNRVYAFGHRFLDGGPTQLPFARSQVVALLPTLSTSFKLCLPREWIGTILSDRATAVAGLAGQKANTIPLTISVQAANASAHDYHFEVVNDQLLTPFVTQTAIFSAIDATERTVGAGTLRLRGRVEFDNNLPPLVVQDIFVSDSGLAQQVAQDAVVTLGFVLGAGFTDLHVKQLVYELQPADRKRQVRIAQIWASRHDVRPGEPIQVTALLEGDNGIELTRTATYQLPVGAPIGPLNLTVSDANGLNAPDFAGLAQSQLHSPAQLIQVINEFRGSEAAYVRVWRQQPSFTITGPLPGGDISDPPPSVMLVLGDPSNSATTSPAQTVTRGSQLVEIKLPVDGFVVSGSRTIQVEVKE
ncbi:MAG: hypothetical protein JO051_00695 [Acidobacteriaceae bacterium]|nr:hypothetical protein [Acidobacteriaceae bacterium]